ncbi:MAG TPA: L-histidine N(alpha)-methyltransferase [Actinomycetota bacterium]|nr:L-histidine N(alpha)-methyltransferase [Actinomycetota bacterium]
MSPAPPTPALSDLIVVDVHLGPDDLARAMREEARRGLTASPKVLSPKWLYDEVGCQLFDEITRLDEYYPTRREREILEARAGEIAEATGADTLIELGSGTSEKTRLLLDAFAAAGTLRRFIPFDIAEPTLRSAAAAVAEEYPGTAVHAVVGDFEHHIGHLPGQLPGGGRRLVAFLGSTIGNLDAAERSRMFGEIAGSLAPGDALLLGCDLVKDVGRLEAAYNDASGVTAAFNLNILSALNRALDARFDPGRFAHVASWDPEQEWIDLRLRAQVRHTVPIHGLGLEIAFEAGEEMRTEISAKFRPEKMACELEAAGFHLGKFFTDAGSDFGLFLAFR